MFYWKQPQKITKICWFLNDIFPPEAYSYYICEAWYNGSYTMAATIKTLELRYPMSQFWIIQNIHRRNPCKQMTVKFHNFAKWFERKELSFWTSPWIKLKLSPCQRKLLAFHLELFASRTIVWKLFFFGGKGGGGGEIAMSCWFNSFHKKITFLVSALLM